MAENYFDRKVRQDKVRLAQDRVARDKARLSEVSHPKASSSSGKKVDHGIFGLDILGL